MARNKYPEEAVEKILDVAERPFMERGNEHTTMADIVESLGGLTKGAVYHQFKRKDEISEAVFERATRGVVARARRDSRDRFHGQFLPLSHTGKNIYGLVAFKIPKRPKHRAPTAPGLSHSPLESPVLPDRRVSHLRQNECTYICVHSRIGNMFQPTPLHRYIPTDLHTYRATRRSPAEQKERPSKALSSQALCYYSKSQAAEPRRLPAQTTRLSPDSPFGSSRASSENPVIIFYDFTTDFKWVDFPFKAKYSGMKMLTAADENIANIRYAYYAMQMISFSPLDHKRHWISEYSHFEIPVPPIEVQREVVRNLDEFTSLTDELIAELAREVTARRQQYAHYRDRLLSRESLEAIDGKPVEMKRLGEVCLIETGRLNAKAAT